MSGQDRKDEAGHPAGSPADLENPQRLSLGQSSNQFADRFLHQQISGAQGWRVLIEMLRGRQCAFREEEAQGIDVAPQDRRQVLSAESAPSITSA